MKKLMLFVGLILITPYLFAQSYNTAGGVRLGNGYGFTLNQRVLDNTTVEGILQNDSKNERFTVTALAKQHFPILIKRLNIYAGGGLHKTFETNSDSTFDNPFGVTGIVGAEFTIARVNFSYDIKPVLNLGSNVEKNVALQTGVSVRYVFIKRPLVKSKEKRQKDRAKKKKKKQKAKGKDSGDSVFDKIKDKVDDTLNN